MSRRIPFDRRAEVNGRSTARSVGRGAAFEEVEEAERFARSLDCGGAANARLPCVSSSPEVGIAVGRPDDEAPGRRPDVVDSADAADATADRVESVERTSRATDPETVLTDRAGVTETPVV